MSRVSGAGEQKESKEEDAKRIDAVDAGISHYWFSPCDSNKRKRKSAGGWDMVFRMTKEA